MGEQRLDLGLTAPAAGCSGDACACGVEAAASAPAADDVIARLDVVGMTCEHCVRAVREELTALDGVDDVEVRLVPGGASAVTVHGRSAVDDAALRAAIDEAGYSLAD